MIVAVNKRLYCFIIGILFITIMIWTHEVYAGDPHQLYGEVFDSQNSEADASQIIVRAYRIWFEDDIVKNVSTEIYIDDPDYFLIDAGSRWQSWSPGDDCVIIIDTISGGYFGSTDAKLTNAGVDIFPNSTLQKIPVPKGIFINGYIELDWNIVVDENENVVGYAIYKSTDNITWQYIGQTGKDTTEYIDDNISIGITYYYSLKIIFQGNIMNLIFCNGSEPISTNLVDMEPPLANAGPNQTVIEDTVVTFDGSNSTDDTGIVEYIWTFSDDNETKILYGQKVNYTFVNPGTYIVTLRVIDTIGNYDEDTMTTRILLKTIDDVLPRTEDEKDDNYRIRNLFVITATVIIFILILLFVYIRYRGV